MSDRTGYALGRLNPILYYQRENGEIAMPPTTEDALYFYEKRFKHQGWMLKEAGTLAEVDDLQKRLVEQERRKLEYAAARDEAVSAHLWRQTGDSLRQRMMSSSTTAYEREFIELYLQLREDKREKHRQRFLETEMYLWAREYDSGTKPTDRMKSEPGDIWREGK